MKVALVQCPAWGRQNPPLALAILSAYLRARGKDVQCLDLNNELFHMVDPESKKLWQLGSEPFWEDGSRVSGFISAHNDALGRLARKVIDTGAGIIGFSVFNSSKEVSLIVARMVKEIDSSRVIIFGGPHCALHMQGREIIKDESVDMMVTGEGESVLNSLVDFISGGRQGQCCRGVCLKKEGQTIDCGQGERVEDLNILPFADFSDFELSSYAEPNRFPIYFSRGCPNRCVYCNENSFWRGYRSRAGQRVFEEMEYLSRTHGATHFDFTDSLVNANVRELSSFADMLIREKLNITWAGQAMIRSYMTPEVLDKLKRSGCICLAYGVESGSQKVLDLMRKGFRVEDAQNVVRDTHNAGIDAVANFMFGFPGETREDFRETLEFVQRNRKYISTVNPSLAYTAIGVGTYLYAHPEEYGIDLSSGYLFWKTSDGQNTYEERRRRYEDFCRLITSLGIKFSYPVSVR